MTELYAQHECTLLNAPERKLEIKLFSILFVISVVGFSRNLGKGSVKGLEK